MPAGGRRADELYPGHRLVLQQPVQPRPGLERRGGAIPLSYPKSGERALCFAGRPGRYAPGRCGTALLRRDAIRTQPAGGRGGRAGNAGVSEHPGGNPYLRQRLPAAGQLDRCGLSVSAHRRRAIERKRAADDRNGDVRRPLSAFSERRFGNFPADFQRKFSPSTCRALGRG